MELLDILSRRRSIRVYTGEPVPEEILTQIVRAGLLAPTSRNLKPCYFTVVRNRDMLSALYGAKASGETFLKDAAEAVVVSADAEKSDTWIEDASIALTCMHLAAAEAGVGSCWIQIRLRRDADGGEAEENVRRILGLDGRFRTVGILALGMPAVFPPSREKDDADFGKVRFV